MEERPRSDSFSRPSTASNGVEKPSQLSNYHTRHQPGDSDSTLHGQDIYINFSRKRQYSQHDTHHFNPSPEIIVDERTLNRLSAHVGLQIDGEHVAGTRQSSRIPQSLPSIWLPLCVVLIPNIVCPAVLLILIFAHKFRSETDLFRQYDEAIQKFPGYILVTFSATRLAIISSVASTLSPFLTSFIMGVWKLHVVGSGREGIGSEPSRYPQFSVLISLLEASVGGLLSYLRARCPRFPRSQKNQTVLPTGSQIHSSALIFSFSLCLVLSMFIADTIFHTYTDAVNVLEVRASPETSLFGHRLIDKCQNFNRSEGECLPCTWDIYGSSSQLQQLSGNVYQIKNNISETSQIQSVGADLSILLPSPARVPNITEYKSSTFGLSTKCRPITHLCQPQVENGTYTQFNCSEAFRGVIDKPPVQPASQNYTIADPDTPPLVLKPTAYLELGFFEDTNLTTPYNPVNYNVSEPGWSTLFGTSSTTSCPADATLLNEIQVGVAGRFDKFSTRLDVDLLDDKGLFNKGEASYYFDFVFRCSLQAHEVEYTWAGEDVRSYTTKPVNGSVLNMYVGQLQYYTNSPGDDWTNDILQMALQDNSDDMASTWGRLFGYRVLSVIGGYSTASANLAEQTRRNVLVTKVPIGGLAFLVACSGVYAVLVSAIAINGCIIVHRNPNAYHEIRDLSFASQMDKNADTELLTSASNGGSGGGVNDMTMFLGYDARNDSHDAVDMMKHAARTNNGTETAWD